MKTLHGIALILSVALFAAGCSTGKKTEQSSIKVYHLGDSARIEDGSLIYALPMTVFKLTFELEKEISVPGPYSKYAPDMLGLNNVITSQSESWSIISAVLNSSEEVDPSEYYVIKSNAACQVNALKLKRSGLILDLNNTIYSRDWKQEVRKTGEIPSASYSDLGSDEYFVIQNDTLYKTVKYDSSFVRIPYLVEKKRILTKEQLAEKAAKSLLELRDGKHSILSGESNIFPQSSAAIDEINKLEKQLTELFTGKKITERKSCSVTIIPVRDDISKENTLLRFSGQEGLLPGNSASGSAITLEIVPAKKSRDITVIPPSVPGSGYATNYDKLYYRLPDVVTLKVKMDGKVLFECRALVDQLGEILQLPSNYILGN